MFGVMGWVIQASWVQGRIQAGVGLGQASCPEIGRQLIKLIDLFDPHVMKNLYGEV